MAEAQQYRSIGTSPIRPDGVDKVTGRAQFGADLNLPNMVYGKVLRSPYAHAIIKQVDVSKALAIPGVYAAICGADFPGAQSGEVGGEGGGDVADVAKNVMARGKALYHGHPVAAVAASSAALAEEALEAIEVQYEPLTPVLDLGAAMAENAPLLDEKCFTKNLPEDPEKPSNIAAVMGLARGDTTSSRRTARLVY